MPRVAAIDCGTNSIRLLIADPPPSADAPLVDVTRRMEIVRLGQGVDRTGRLAPAAIERTRVALAGYAASIRSAGATRVRMVATSATRDAANREDFHAMVVDTLGAEPEVVTGDEEARLSFGGAVRGLGPHPEARAPYLVVDIGGGSTEFVLGSAGDDPSLAARSVDVGCVRLTERHLHGDPPAATEVAAAEADVRAALDLVRAAVPVEKAGTLVGLAGSVTTVTALALGLPRYDSTKIHHATVTYDQVAVVARDLLAMPRSRRAALGPMHPGRVDVIGAGALILRVVMDELGTDAVIASEHDILDGIALSLL
jgi:exopolyphosphatase/guanosine-5'-triphosphate,3'-diphosphate pyrophosphatase